ncbi:MAG TPA: hypothetical protein VHX90_02235 [Verrucomicrobiae bacterium]|jgi:hypothetical protein|nr:hypothetical protein [Verrucomicrobiae bacterium]
MQFSKFMPLLCAAIVCAGFISARADDSPAQAAARVALDQKMRELDAQPVSTNAETPPAIVVTPSGAMQEQSAPSTASADNAAQAKALEALQQKMSQLDKQPPVETTPTSSDSDAQAAARAALDQKMRELDAQQASANTKTLPVIIITPSIAAPEQPVQTAPVQTSVVAMPPPSDVNYPGKSLGFKPIEAPELPISADKEAQLQALLIVYKADRITPAEYQVQRAKILSEP